MFTLDKNDLNTANKLALLYLIDQFNFELTNSQIAKLLINITEMNYFYIQQYLIELVNDNFLDVRVDNNNRFYTINKNGREIISSFKTSVKASIRKSIDTVIRENRETLKNETQVYAHYDIGEAETYTVTCGINEGKLKMIEIKFLANSPSHAQSLCETWKKDAENLYGKIVDIMSKRDN